MTRQECERQLIALGERAAEIYRQYNPGSNDIYIQVSRDGYIGVSDLTVDTETKEITNWTLDGAKNQEGEVYSLNYDSMTVPA